MKNKPISIIHPSRQRPLMAYETYKKWMTNAVNPPEVEYILSVDNDDPTLQQYNWEFRKNIWQFPRQPLRDRKTGRQVCAAVG